VLRLYFLWGCQMRLPSPSFRPGDTDLTRWLLTGPWNWWEQDRLRGIFRSCVHKDADKERTPAPRCPSCGHPRSDCKCPLLWIPSDGTGGLETWDLRPPFVSHKLQPWRDERAVEQRSEDATRFLKANGSGPDGRSPSSRQSVSARILLAPVSDRADQNPPLQILLDRTEAIHWTWLDAEEELHPLHPIIERCNREARARNRAHHKVWIGAYFARPTKPVLGRVPIPKGFDGVGFEPESLGLNGVPPSRWRKRLAGRRERELEQLVWWAWTHAERYGIRSKQQLAEHFGVPVTTVKTINARKEAQMDTQAVIAAVREEGERTRHEVTMAIYKAETGETPAEAMERHLAESCPETSFSDAEVA
jgi:hypothetical protein